MTTVKKQVLSCIQPTGDIHFGNYFGAIKNWVNLQEEYDCVYGVVDYHAMTMPYDVKKLRNNTWDMVFSLIASGIQPDNLFIQSLVPEHAELCWIFNCYTSFGWMERMTQFKDKSSMSTQKSKDAFISVGLFDYPILQAADILIYKADFVPVGKDQTQHLELTRDIAQRFNNSVGKEYFVLPETLYTETPNIRSTADPSKKMSKSAGEKHYIGIYSEEARIRKQVRSAVTDVGEPNKDKMSDGVANLFELLNAGEETSIAESLMQSYKTGELKYVDLKDAVADMLVALSAGFTARRAELLENKRAVKDQIKASSEVIRKQAKETLKEVKDLTGLLIPKQ